MMLENKIGKKAVLSMIIAAIVLETIKLTLGYFFSTSINNVLNISTLTLTLFSLSGTLIIGRKKLNIKDKALVLILTCVILYLK